ncbi:MAG: ribonuclease E/G [Rubellimicrobium sp.]|nr:ribonuclease E/G [Rubellimicrobium sp.]
MSRKMLIDATHPEETRVVVADGNRVEDFDFESAARRQLAGNIYLAKITRVEPSLQAAFVDYGGNRHGFLAFSEIHPSYYQIPVADRDALLAEEAAAGHDDHDEPGDNGNGKADARSRGRGGRSRSRSRAATASNDAVAVAEPSAAPDDDAPVIAGMETIDLGDDGHDDDDTVEGLSPMLTVADTPVDTPLAGEDGGSDDDGDDTGAADPGRDPSDEAPAPGQGSVDEVEKDDTIEVVAEEDDDASDHRPRARPRARHYKIQEVVKVRQIMLVQVVKEERGNKGAALTTYLSLAGRYCVLMPNTARGGGISRKITNAVDRKKLKEIAGELEVPQGAGLIIRTAGSQRTKAEIKRDYEYLQRLWEQIRELTLQSIAPAKIYEEGDLIKRSIRDLYSREIDEVIVEGAEGYRVAKDFMKMIMPSHAKNVQPYTDPMPLFSRYQVEGYLASMFNPVVQLPSGGYIVIGVTEALVAIDVNSGRATREGSIEQTALKTNLEAADEISRQLRLRDLAGLIVIDFIDMDERKHNAAVEKRFKDKLKTDRARIQVGRISGFGLLEMSRQRLRPGMIEATTQPCPHCHGTGLLRSDGNVALAILRQLEEEGVRGRNREVLVKAPFGIANFLINDKREHVAAIEQRYGMAVRIEADPALVSPDFTVEKFKTATRALPDKGPVVTGNASLMGEIDDETPEDDAGIDEIDDSAAEPADNGEQPKKRRRRRRPSRRRNGETNGNGADTTADEDDGDAVADEAGVTEAAEAPVAAEPDAEAGDAAPAPRKRRLRKRPAEAESAEAPAEPAPVAEAAADAPAEAAAPARRPRRSRAKPAPEVVEAAAPAPDEPAPEPEAPAPQPVDVVAESAPEPVAAPAAAPEPAPVEPAPEPEAAAAEVESEAAPVPAETAPEEPPKPRRRGWWSRG